ncbi:Secretory carrier-associated membrane protein 2 [Stylosanthes scabra]|uniref:Secretory carrier-associated membrane protein n=1 Tax=Stylosanthes scabra TaxID=79078 RepID=A0ABU6YTN0_9FABA|nr:Secretory carrier-associated membrane protein 2 [Stylosanthes scabra]
MAGRYDSNPFDEEEVNPFSNTGTVAPATNSRLPPLKPEPADYNYGFGATVDIPLDSSTDVKKKEKELQSKEVELKRREQLHIGFCILAAVAPPIVFKGKSLTGILSAIDVLGDHALIGIFYFIGFGLFCIETLISIWVIQQVYMYFRGSGKAAEMKREAARGTLRAAI